MIASKDIQSQEDQSLKKHVAAIHATNPLTLIQRKLANALLFHAYPNLLTNEEHIISVKELCSLIGFESHAIEQVKAALKKLLSTVIEWNLVDKDKESKDNYWAASAILASVEIKGGICRYTYSKHLRTMLYQPEIFASLDMTVLKSFKSSYGLALYENCVRFKKIKQTKWFELSLFRKLMGVAENKYTKFFDFKRRVIDSAVQEINDSKLCRILLTPEFKQEGRVVKAVKFHIKEKFETDMIISIPFSAEDEGVFNMLINELKIEANLAKEFIAEYGASYVLDKAKYIMSTKTFRAGNMSYPAQYLKKALKENYIPPKSSGDLLREARDRKEAEQEAQKLINKKMEKNRTAYSNYKSELIMSKFNQFNAKEKKNYLKYFSKELGNDPAPVLLNLFNRSELDSPLVKVRFISFLLERIPNMLDNILGFDEFVENAQGDY